MTLPPPEWSAPTTTHKPKITVNPPGIARRTGIKAEEATLRLRVAAARAAGNAPTTRGEAVALARWLASRDRCLDEATTLAAEALAISQGVGPADRDELRRELSSWWESLGALDRAAEALRPIADARAGEQQEPQEAAQVLARVGLLWARAGNAKRADKAFSDAMQLAPEEARPAELRGAVATWGATDEMRERIVISYLEAAARRGAAGQKEAQLEDLLRAFNAAPTSQAAAHALARAFDGRGRGSIADEVWRTHAAALSKGASARAGAIHAARRTSLLASGDPVSALGAALDAGLDAHFEGEGASTLDDLLARVGLFDVLAARIEIRAERSIGEARGRAYEELGRLFAGPLAQPERAAEANVAALGADAGREDALAALRSHAASTGDPTMLVEGLVRAVLNSTPRDSSASHSSVGRDARVSEKPGRGARAARIACARELARYAEEKLEDVKLASWAYERILAVDLEDGAAVTWTMRNGTRVAAARGKLEAAKRAASAASGEARIPALRAVVERLRGSPAEWAEYARILGELAAAEPHERKWTRLATLLAWRRGNSVEAARLAMARFGVARTPEDKVDARRTLAAAARAQGDISLASDEARELLDDAPGSRVAASLAWVAASLAGDAKARARAIAHVAPTCALPLRALLFAVAAESAAAQGERAEARRLAEAASEADSSSPRAVTELANALVGETERVRVALLEKAYNATFARSAWCRAISLAYEALGDAGHAVSWTQRLVSLLPGDRGAVETYLAQTRRLKDAPRLADALAWVLTQPLPVGQLADLYAAALLELASLDAERGVVLARRTLDVFGPAQPAIRSAMLEVARKADDPAFAAAVLERVLSTSPPEAERRSVVQDLLAVRVEMGDADAVARVLLRAVREGVSDAVLARHFDLIAAAVLGGDGELARLEANALFAAQRRDASAAARGFRELGAARWDLAEDRDGAIDAWILAAQHAPTLGYPTLGADLARFGDPSFALDVLVARMDQETNLVRSGALATEAARTALKLDDPERAMALARVALERAPSAGDALAILERAAVALGREDEMTGLYDYVGGRALGRFGRRAAHYRAARFYEARGASALALKHAAKAFTAVPSDGSIFVMLARTATLAHDFDQAVRAVEEVSAQAASPRARAAWLLRAATITGTGHDGAHARVELLMRAVVASPELGTVALLRDAARELLRVSPDERDALEPRLGRAATNIAGRLDGPDGARVAIALTELLLAVFEAPETALAVLERALACDGDLDDYARLLPYAKRIAASEETRLFLDRALEAAEKPYANVGVAAMRFMAALAAALDDRVGHARALIGAAAKSEDDGPVLEAEAAVRALGEPILIESFAARVPAPRRVEALRAAAATMLAAGAQADAIEALERASVLADAPTKVELEAQLRSMYDVSGRGTELEARAMREAMNAQNTTSIRAQHWADLAERREGRRDMRGAVAALYAAAKCEPDSVERWSALERVAEAAGNVEARIEALNAISERVAEEGKVAVQKRLARAFEARGDTANAADAWRTVLTMDPDDEEADQALEGFIVGEARYADLADHLARRADRLSAFSGQRERLRALRLRRTAILEQRLGRIEDACDELALLLAEWPDNASALRYLADLHERMGEHGRAAPLWRRVASLERNPEVQSELELRAARASQASGDVDVALAHVKAVLARAPSNRDAMQMRITFARSVGNDQELGDALEAAATHSQDDSSSRSSLLVEAAQAAARAGDMIAALGRAQRAAAVSPDSAATQLLARGLEYRLRGVGAPADARLTLEELGKIRGGLEPDDEALCAFLLAEALDAVHGGGAGMRELVARREDLGLHVLIALGIAERLNSQGSYAAAVPMFEKALSGNLFGLRRRGAVAIAAGEAAMRCDHRDAARRFLTEASQDVDTRPAALRKLAQLDSNSAKPPALRADAIAALGSREGALAALETTARNGPTPEDRVAARLALARAHTAGGDTARAEAALMDALLDGSSDAGIELAGMLEQTPDRATDLLRVRKLLADLAPGDIDLLTELKAAATADENPIYARTIEHIIRAFDPGAGPLPPPPLGAQREQPGVLTFLTRAPDARAFEALALVWEGAGALFARDPASYGVTGMERIAPGSATALGRLYEVARRLLDVPKVPFFLKRSASRLSFEVALLAQPSVIISGEPDEDTAELRYLVGCAMAAALPGNALVLGLPEGDARRMWRAVLGAFGPPEFGRRMDTPSARLAESFWQMIPQRTQRRLQELLGTGPAPEFEAVRAGATQSSRRVGLFVCGDFEAAVLNVLRDTPERELGARGAPNALRRLCIDLPEVTDLLRLASTREYADARWQPSATMPPRSSSSGLVRTTK